MSRPSFLVAFPLAIRILLTTRTWVAIRADSLRVPTSLARFLLRVISLSALPFIREVQVPHLCEMWDLQNLSSLQGASYGYWEISCSDPKQHFAECAYSSELRDPTGYACCSSERVCPRRLGLWGAGGSLPDRLNGRLRLHVRLSPVPAGLRLRGGGFRRGWVGVSVLQSLPGRGSAGWGRSRCHLHARGFRGRFVRVSLLWRPSWHGCGGFEKLPAGRR